MKNLFDTEAIKNVIQLTTAITGSEGRTRIVDYLRTHPKTTGTQLSHVLKIERNYVTAHLKILRDAGIVSGEKDSTKTLYSLNDAYIKSLNEQFRNLSITLQESQ